MFVKLTNKIKAKFDQIWALSWPDLGLNFQVIVEGLSPL